MTSRGSGWATAVSLPRRGEGGAQGHHTLEFDDGDEDDVSGAEFANPQLIVRRGATATFSVDVALPAEQDAAVLEAIDVVLADTAVPRSNRIVFQPVGDAEPAAGDSAAKVVSATRVEVSIVLPDDMPVGQYHMNFSIGGRPALRGPVVVLVLFNAWCTSADEYMPDPAAREEYVLLEDGLIHFGSFHSPGRSGWNYGQFEPGVLAAALKILTTLRPHQRADPVLVSR